MCYETGPKTDCEVVLRATIEPGHLATCPPGRLLDDIDGFAPALYASGMNSVAKVINLTRHRAQSMCSGEVPQSPLRRVVSASETRSKSVASLEYHVHIHLVTGAAL